MTEKMIWGPSPFPAGAESLGIIKHPVDGMLGVLFKMPTGILVHGAAGVIRSIGQNPAAALGSIKSAKKAASSRENGKKGGRPPADIDDRLRRDVLKAEARGEARVELVNTPDGRTLERVMARILVPASIERARAGKETGWTIGDWSVYR